LTRRKKRTVKKLKVGGHNIKFVDYKKLTLITRQKRVSKSIEIRIENEHPQSVDSP
jgi:hypothetical protein